MRLSNFSTEPLAKIILVASVMVGVAFARSKVYAQESSPDTVGVFSNASQMVPPTYFPVLIAPRLTMRSGAQSLLTIHKGVTQVEDKFIGTRWFSESSVAGKSGGVLARMTKYALLDIPIDYFFVVFAHEYLGHGARYRELRFDDIHYGFDWPPPYGKGGGEASLTSSVPISNHELLSIWEGGIEVHSVLNRNLSLRWMTKREMTYREASLYFWSYQIMMNYIQDANEDLTDGTKDDDPRAYTRILNANAGYADAANLEMTVGDLKSKMAINAVNPFVFYSLYSILKTYLWDGEQSTRIPTIPLGTVDYLPGLRAGWTPFGVAYHLDNYLRFGSRVVLVDLSLGDQTFHDSWGGINVDLLNIFTLNNFSFDMNGNLWNQPGIDFEKISSASTDDGFGGAFSLRGYYNFANTDLPISTVLELGYKTAGFMEGYQLDAVPILMVGLAWYN